MRDVYKEAEQYFKDLVAENPFNAEARDWLSFAVAMQNEVREIGNELSTAHGQSLSKVILFNGGSRPKESHKKRVLH